MNAFNLPLKVKIASPCPARWEDMGGDDRVRFCDQCRKNVYNLSALTAKEASDVLTAKNGNLCARVFQRADGTVLTEDCPVGMAKYWRQIKLTLAGAVTVLFCATCYAIGEPAPVTAAREEVLLKVQGWLGIKLPLPRQPTMGKLRTLAPKPPPQQTLGEMVCSQPPQSTSTNAPIPSSKK